MLAGLLKLSARLVDLDHPLAVPPHVFDVKIHITQLGLGDEAVTTREEGSRLLDFGDQVT